MRLIHSYLGQPCKGRRALKNPPSNPPLPAEAPPSGLPPPAPRGGPTARPPLTEAAGRRRRACSRRDGGGRSAGGRGGREGRARGCWEAGAHRHAGVRSCCQRPLRAALVRAAGRSAAGGQSARPRSAEGNGAGGGKIGRAAPPLVQSAVGGGAWRGLAYGESRGRGIPWPVAWVRGRGVPLAGRRLHSLRLSSSLSSGLRSGFHLFLLYNSANKITFRQLVLRNAALGNPAVFTSRHLMLSLCHVVLMPHGIFISFSSSVGHY